MKESIAMQTVLEMLRRSVEDRPHHPAVEHAGVTLSYAQLWERSTQITVALAGHGGEQAEPIAALAVAPGCAFVAGLVGILRTGWTCLPVDVRTSSSYNEALMSAAGACCAVTDTGLRAISDAPTPAALAARGAPRAPHPGARAYLFYTSGSTGQPKGVEVLHRGVARLVRDRSVVPLCASDRIAQCASVAFDGSTFEIWGALANGGTVVVPPRWPLSPHEFAAFVHEASISVLVITAAFFTLLMRDAPETFDAVRMIVVGGDVVPLQGVRSVAARRPDLIIVNGYGPTEDTTMSCQHRVVPADWTERERIPIGRPLQGTRVAVLDDDHQPVSVGSPGELFLGGDGLARGYLDNPEATAARFFEIVVDGRMERLYASGDLVIDTGDGVLEFLGRRDSQVKIRGNRVELRAVEHAILGCDRVAAAAVLVQGDTAAEKTLAAFVVPAAGCGEQGLASAVRRHLRSHWPVAYSPARLEIVPALPLTRNGKVDMAALKSAMAGPVS